MAKGQVGDVLGSFLGVRSIDWPPTLCVSVCGFFWGGTFGTIGIATDERYLPLDQSRHAQKETGRFPSLTPFFVVNREFFRHLS